MPAGTIGRWVGLATIAALFAALAAGAIAVAAGSAADRLVRADFTWGRIIDQGAVATALGAGDVQAEDFTWG